MTDINTEMLARLKNNYFETFDIEAFAFDTRLSEDLNKDFFALRPDLSGRVTGDFNLFNGTIVHPRKNRDDFTLLFNKEYVDKTVAKGTNDWIGTFAHEITHMVDYKAYLGLSGAEDYDEIRYSGKHKMFFFWTEFHARKNGYYFWQKQTGVEYNDIRLEVIKAQEYPFQKKYLLEKYKSTADDQKLMYYLCQFMGRLAVWEEAFPDFFDSVRIKAILEKFDGSLLNFYRFFHENRDIKTAVNKFSQLESEFDRSFKTSV